MINRYKSYAILLMITSLLFPLTALAGNIDPENKDAYGENIGWINFAPSQGSGVTVTDSSLNGYAWGENIGWINLDPTNGGVNNDGAGNLSGYAWGENVGWINFAPPMAGVKIDPVTGAFSGKAWGENIGWINFAPNGVPVKTLWRGDSTPPTGTIEVNAGAAYTNSTGVTLALSCTDTGNGCAQTQFSNDNSNWSTPGDYITSMSWTLTSGDGPKTVYVKFKDKDGNWSSIYSDSIILDMTAPTTTASPIGGTYNSSQSVALTCNDGTGSGCDKIYHTTDGSTPTTSSPAYSSPINIQTTTTLKFFAKDKAGNSEAPAKSETYTINLPPVANNQSITTNENIPLAITLTATDPEGNPLTYIVVSVPVHGALSGTAPNLTYTPSTNYSGPDSFTFKANDGTSDSNIATVSITVTPLWSLTINISPPGSGTVTKNPDKASYGNNEQVTLTANPATGYNFSSWSGCTSVNGNTCSVTMSSNKTVTATFNQSPVVNYTLSLAKTGNGSVKVNGTSQALPWSGQFASGTQVQIEAVADSGWSFSNWSGDLTGSTNPTTVNMNGNKNITANFTQNCDRILTINISPAVSGTVTKNPDKASYCNNEQVTLTANSNSGFNFSSWSGVDSSSGATANITMNDNRTIEANFGQQAADEPEINVTPKSKEFGNKKLGEISAPESITVSNIGSGDLVIGPLSITDDDAGVFTKQNDNCSGKTLKQSEHCVVEVVFSPVTMGSFHAGLLIPSNDADEPAMIVDLKGGSGADLTGTWISMKETCKNTKKGIKCSLKGNLTVQNTGNKDIKTSSVKFYLSDDGMYDGGDTYLKKVSTGKIKAGKSQKKTFSYSFKTGISTSGKYVIVVLDADNQVVEADEENNDIIYGPLP